MPRECIPVSSRVQAATHLSEDCLPRSDHGIGRAQCRKGPEQRRVMLKGKVTVDRRHRLKAQADTITRVLRVAGLLELAACTFAVAWPDPLALAGRLAQHSARLSRTAHHAHVGLDVSLSLSTVPHDHERGEGWRGHGHVQLLSPQHERGRGGGGAVMIMSSSQSHMRMAMVAGRAGAVVVMWGFMVYPKA